MTAKIDPSARRIVELEFEVPGTPEQVWQAIATGPGISSWLFLTEAEERAGGAVAFHMGPGMESAGTVTAWEPPVRFAYEEPDWSPNAPPLGTEFIIEARSGDTCVVRLVHSLFASSEEWDGQLEGFETGWNSFFRVLRLYLSDFQGLPCAPFRVMGDSSRTEAEVWATLSTALGLADTAKGQRLSTPAFVPQIAGVVERGGEDHEVLLRLEEPAPGIAMMGAHTWGGRSHAAISFFLYGDQAPAAAAREEPLWSAWMKSLFPQEAA